MSAGSASTASSPPGRLTAADLEALPNEKDYELLDGQLVQRHGGYVSFVSSRVAVNLIVLLETFCKDMKLGKVLPMDFGYQCFADDPEKVRKPDVSFIRADRLRSLDMPRGYCKFAPDLAVEVISPNELSSVVFKKVMDYLAAGVGLVWVVDPSNHQIETFHHTKTLQHLSPSSELTGEDVIPGFRCQLSELFALPPEVA